MFPDCIASAVRRMGLPLNLPGISLCVVEPLNLPVAMIIPTVSTARSLISVSKLPHHGKAETT